MVTCVSKASYILQASLLVVDKLRPSALHACERREVYMVTYERHLHSDLGEKHISNSGLKLILGINNMKNSDNVHKKLHVLLK